MSGRTDRRAYDPHFGVAYRSAEAILSHAEFPRARLVYLDSVLTLYGGNAFLNKLLMEAARIVIFAVVICLEAGYRKEDRATWPTVGNLKKALALFNIASPRRIDHVLGRLIQTGYLESKVSPQDRRARLLLPTDRMKRHDQDWLAAHYAPLAILYGDADYALPLRGDPEFQRVQRQIATGFFAQSAMVLLRNPDIMLFLTRDAGILVLAQLVKEAMNQGATTVPLSFADLSRRFVVSRTHVRQLLMDAEAQGLVALSQDRRQVTLTPRILGSLNQFIADGMSNHDLTGAAARKALAEMRTTTAMVPDA